MDYPPTPPLFAAALPAPNPPQYQWDEWDPYLLLGDADQRVQSILRSVSDRAKLAFAIACAEWVVGRLEPWLKGDTTPWQFIEACWAFQMSDLYALPPESDESKWQGLVRAPIDLSLMTILNTAIGAEDDNAEVDAALAAQIALHVLVNRRAFLHWRRLVLHRLRRIYPIDAGARRGDPVPREALIAPSEFDHQAAAMPVTLFLTNLKTNSNRYLVRQDSPLSDGDSTSEE